MPPLVLSAFFVLMMSGPQAQLISLSLFCKRNAKRSKAGTEKVSRRKRTKGEKPQAGKAAAVSMASAKNDREAIEKKAKLDIEEGVWYRHPHGERGAKLSRIPLPLPFVPLVHTSN